MFSSDLPHGLVGREVSMRNNSVKVVQGQIIKDHK